jgi:hypothetical protein
VTTHSPIGKDPEKYGLRLLPSEPVTFAKNDVAFQDTTGCDHDRLGEGLRKALYNYMHGAGIELDVRVWFGKKGNQYLVPKTKVPRDLIHSALFS